MVAAPAYLRAHGEPAEPHDLLRHTCLRYRFVTSNRTADWDFQGDAGYFTVAARGKLVTHSLSAIVDSAVKGDGLAHMVTRFVRPYIEDGSLVTVLNDYAYTYPALYLYYPRENRQHEMLRAFVQIFKQ